MMELITTNISVSTQANLMPFPNYLSHQIDIVKLVPHCKLVLTRYLLFKHWTETWGFTVFSKFSSFIASGTSYSDIFTWFCLV